MADIFNFKQFTVNQAGCAMKVNTDGVLLGALAGAPAPKTILDIGTGTGVITLMLAQRFENAVVEAVEIEQTAAVTAKENFKASKFAGRLSLFAIGFEAYFETCADKQFDLIVSNPPFFLNSLASPGAKKNLARHTDGAFFERLVKGVATHLSPDGVCVMILPLDTAVLVKELLTRYELNLQSIIHIKSFTASAPHREVISFGRNPGEMNESDLVIYNAPKEYAEQYQSTLKAFLTIF